MNEQHGAKRSVGDALASPTLAFRRRRLVIHVGMGASSSCRSFLVLSVKLEFTLVFGRVHRRMVKNG
jgi:hypothetical protein